MDVQKIVVDPDEVRRLHQDYKSQVKFETDVDREIRQIYAALNKGKVIIMGAASIVAAGVKEDGLPKLAMAKANVRQAFLHIEGHYDRPNSHPDRMVRMSHTRNGAQGRTRHERMGWLQSAWPGLRQSQYASDFTAPMPLIPGHLRPKVALDAYHVMWEAEWSRIVPKDPYLLRRIGKSDMFLVVAHWDLTEIERAVLQSRISVN